MTHSNSVDSYAYQNAKKNRRRFLTSGALTAASLSFSPIVGYGQQNGNQPIALNTPVSPPYQAHLASCSGTILITGGRKITTRTYTYVLGETSIIVEESRNADGRVGPVYFHPHEDEETSYETALHMVGDTGGVLYALKHGGERLISFVLDGQIYQIDPNRMFTRPGIVANLKLYGACTEQAVDAVYGFSRWLSGLMTSDQVFAVHNNRDTTYNIKSYVVDGHPAPGVRDVYINSKMDPGNFIYTTNAVLFATAKDNKLNTVLQDPNVENDGSYAVFAQKHNIDYINVETKRGDSEHDFALIKFVNRFYGYTPPLDASWGLLKRGDLIDLVATSSAYVEKDIPIIQQAFDKLGLRTRTKYAVQANPPPLGYSNTDDMRLKMLIGALNDPESAAVWGIRGGAGSTNLLPRLVGITPPERVKPLIGFSDVTSIFLFLAGQWGWPSIHGVLASFNAEVDPSVKSHVNLKTSLTSVTKILLGEESQVSYTGLKPLNTYAQASFKPIRARLFGGNLTLFITALSTPFVRDHIGDTILFLEDVGNSAHQLERLLDQVAYSNIMQDARAVILGEFLEKEEGDSPETIKTTDLVLARFARRVNMPVFRFNRFGHGEENVPLPVNTAALISRETSGMITLQAAAR